MRSVDIWLCHIGSVGNPSPVFSFALFDKSSLFVGDVTKIAKSTDLFSWKLTFRTLFTLVCVTSEILNDPILYALSAWFDRWYLTYTCSVHCKFVCPGLLCDFVALFLSGVAVLYHCCHRAGLSCSTCERGTSCCCISFMIVVCPLPTHELREPLINNYFFRDILYTASKLITLSVT